MTLLFTVEDNNGDAIYQTWSRASASYVAARKGCKGWVYTSVIPGKTVSMISNAQEMADYRRFTTLHSMVEQCNPKP